MLMKRMLFAWIAMAASLTIGWSCSDSDTDDGGTGSGNGAQLLTYGFYAEDNAALTQDYVATVDREMIIRLPEEVDKTALIARFTTTEGAEVLVGSTPQVSGVTPNDFTYPVDYIVKDAGGVSSSYTVRVGKILEKEWKEVLVYNDNGLENDAFAMCISPKDNTPYFFITRVNADEVEAGVVASFNGTAMTAGSEFTYNSENTLIDASNIDIAADADGKIYAVYYNSAKLSDGSTYDRKYYVYTGSGSSWTQVGSKFGTTGYDSSIEIDPATKNPIVAFRSNAAAGAVARRDLDVNYFNGQSWSENNTISDIQGKTIYGYQMRVFDNTLYLSGLVQNAPGSYFVFKYNSGSWQPVANALPAGMSQTNMMGTSFAVASDGTVYICCGGDEDSNGTWYITVYKCAPGESAWTRVATPIVDKTGSGMSTSSKFLLDLYNDQPVVLYKNLDTGIPQVVMLNAETKQWDDPVVLGTVEAGSNFALEFDANGVGYAAFLDKGELSSLHVYKFDTEEDDLPE